jgi:hypothetical protein
MVKIQQKEYFEQKALELEELISGLYPELYTEPRIDPDEGTVALQAELRIPHFEGTFFVEWVYYVNEEDKDFAYECVIFTTEGEELGLVYSDSPMKAATECAQEVQKMLLETSGWLSSVFLE